MLNSQGFFISDTEGPFSIKDVLKDDEALTEQILELVKNQHEY